MRYGYYGYGFDTSYLLVLAALAIGLWAQWRVKSVYREYAKVRTRAAVSAAETAMDMLRRNGNTAVSVRPVGGELTDNYDPSSETLNLSQGVYGSDSIAAIGIAAHEAGHAMQKHSGYKLLALRSTLVPAVQIGSNAAVPLFLLGMIMSLRPLMFVGIAAFALTTVFSLVTLPVELDASRRALAMLSDGGYLTGEEMQGVQKVLKAAAMTYVAAAIGSVANLARLILISQRGSRRR